MRLRTALLPLALATMLLVAGCSGPMNAVPNADAETTAGEPSADASAAQAGNGTEQTITVGASGSIEAEPDRAVVEVAVTASGEDVSTVLRDANLRPILIPTTGKPTPMRNSASNCTILLRRICLVRMKAYAAFDF